MTHVLVLLVVALADEKPGAAFEKRFLEVMTYHHQAGVDMAEVCRSKAAHGELKTLCDNLSAKEQREKQTMDDWRRLWYQDQRTAPKAEMDKVMADHQRHLSALNNAAAADFDAAFAEIMIAHHREGIAEATACSTQATHAELKEYCGRIKADHEKEVATLQNWLKEWGGGSRK